MEIITTSLVLVLSLILLLYWFQTKNFNYWKDRNVPYIRPHWFFGGIKNAVLKKITWRQHVANVYDQFKDNGFGGVFFFRTPAIFICKPELIDKVLVQDFVHFHDRANVLSAHETLSKSLLDASGERWRILRYNLLPAFTSGKLQGMFEQIFNCGDHMLRKIEEAVGSNEPIEMDSQLFDFTTEVIASCTFGLQVLSDPSQSKKFKNATNALFKPSYLCMVKVILACTKPSILKLLRIKVIPTPVTEFFTNLTKATINYRQQNGVKRNDILNLMLSLKAQEERGFEPLSVLEIRKKYLEINQAINDPLKEILDPGEKVFTEDLIISQLFAFFTAGTNPSITAVSFSLFEVSKRPAIQKKLQREIDLAIAKQGGWNYAALKEMTYLDQVIQESLRLYSYANVLVRVTTGPYKLPGTDVTLEKGTMVYIPSSAIHMDPQYYPDSEQFIPERFAGNNYKPSPLFLPFGHGPRICIAIKFAVLLMKVCLARILSTYNVKLSSKMQLPLNFDMNSYFPKADGGLWLTFNKRNT